MKRSSNTPATFIAIPWTPVGRPKRNSARMMPQSGRQSMPRCHTTGSRPESNRYTAVPLMTRPATVVPTAAPAVPRRGRGPRPVMNATLHAMFNTVRRIPRRIGVRASPAARSAPPTMKNSSIPMLPTNMMRRNGNASWRTAGAALTTPSSDGARTQPSGASSNPQSASAARKAWYTVRLTFSRSLAPAKRATSTPIPLNTDMTNTITTMKIWIATPMAALPAYPTK